MISFRQTCPGATFVEFIYRAVKCLDWRRVYMPFETRSGQGIGVDVQDKKKYKKVLALS